MSKLARDNRNADITKIQIARKQLGLSDDDYRTILATQGNGATSSKDLDHDGRMRVLAHMQRIGFRPKSKPGAPSRRPKRPTPAIDAAPLVRRIRAQLISLDRKPDEYADGIAKQMLGDDAPQFFEWCNLRDLYKISQALGIEQRRKGVPDGR
ncbi:gp16 family protein [Pseudacidovorax intermedius]|uniref:gp16 family protein n=1 Tax=Pseudacidovorax intermedius TaxID=433924 RepID=UPI0026EF7362|nr:regulatory protein GemA [Pseudacidovorax intermedius]